MAAENVAADNSRLASEQAAVALDDAPETHQQGAERLRAGRDPRDARVQAVHDADRAGRRSASVETRRRVHQRGGDPGRGAHATGPDVQAARQEQRGDGGVPPGLRDRQGAGGPEAGDRRLAPQPGGRACSCSPRWTRNSIANMQAALAHNKESLALFEDIDRNPKADETRRL